MSTQNLLSACYVLEISGWDGTEKFFVETTELDWSKENDMQVHLRHSLRVGALVFVRLLHPTTSVDRTPVAYLVETVMEGDAPGTWLVCLTQLHPRSRTNACLEQAPGQNLEKKFR
jgi:hypothetical protein